MIKVWFLFNGSLLMFLVFLVGSINGQDFFLVLICVSLVSSSVITSYYSLASVELFDMCGEKDNIINFIL